MSGVKRVFSFRFYPSLIERIRKHGSMIYETDNLTLIVTNILHSWLVDVDDSY